MNRTWSSTTNDPAKNCGMEWNGFYGTDYEKGLMIKRNLFLSPSKERDKEGARSWVSLYETRKKKDLSERIWYQPYTSSFVTCFKFLWRMFRRCENLRQAGLIRLKPWYCFINHHLSQGAILPFIRRFLKYLLHITVLSNSVQYNPYKLRTILFKLCTVSSSLQRQNRQRSKYEESNGEETKRKLYDLC